MAERGGVKEVTLDPRVPPHTHEMYASTEAGSTNLPAGAFTGTGSAIYAPPNTLKTMNQTFATGSSPSTPAVAHNNMMPYLTVYFCIAAEGEYPSRP